MARPEKNNGLRSRLTGRPGRRHVATVLALPLAVACGWHAVFGQNGIIAYAQKRSEDHALQQRIQVLAGENAQLKDHVDHLKSDPDTIEMEARRRLHYTRSGEVIYTMRDGADTRKPSR